MSSGKAELTAAPDGIASPFHTASAADSVAGAFDAARAAVGLPCAATPTCVGALGAVWAAENWQ